MANYYSDQLAQCLEYLQNGRTQNGPGEESCLSVCATTSTERGDVTGCSFTSGQLLPGRLSAIYGVQYKQPQDLLIGGTIIIILMAMFVKSFFK